MANVSVPSRPDRIRVENYDYEHGLASTICDCGCRYDEHVKVPGYWWLRRLCDGALVKLVG